MEICILLGTENLYVLLYLINHVAFCEVAGNDDRNLIRYILYKSAKLCNKSCEKNVMHD